MIKLTPVLSQGTVYFVRHSGEQKYLLFNRVDTKLGLCFTDISNGNAVNLQLKDLKEQHSEQTPVASKTTASGSKTRKPGKKL